MKKRILLFLFCIFINTLVLFSQLSSPVLVLPPTNDRYDPTTITLQWQAPAGATGYIIQYANSYNGVLAQPQIDSPNVFNTQYTFTAGVLQPNTVYYWRVLAFGSGGWSLPSEIWNFRTAGSPSQEIANSTNDVNSLLSAGILPQNQANILNTKLEHAQNQLNMNHTDNAIDKLQAFEERVSDLHESGILSSDNVTLLNGGPDYIIAVIRGGNHRPGILNTVRPFSFSLSQNYPNPFNPSTAIEYSVPGNSFVSLKIYDINGREIAQLINNEQNTGHYIKIWDASNVSSGVYFYVINVSGQSGSFSQTRKMLLLK